MKNIKRMIAVAVLMMSAVAAFAQSSTTYTVPPAQNTGGYAVLSGKVYYNNVILHEADPHTIQYLGYGYAKDNENVWYEGKILPLVDARSFRLKNSVPPSGPAVPPPPAPGPQAGQNYGLGDLIAGLLSHIPGNGLGHNHGHVVPDNPPVYQEAGYEIVGTKVYYNGAVVSNASAHSFKDLGWGYAKDSSRVYYCGKKLSNDPTRFKALTDGYAMDTFDVYYFGKKIDASTSGFKVLSDGYAKDAFDAYYCGKKVAGSSGSTFQVLGNGYAKDAWETYYLGKKVK
jgi:hypothetical protein